MDDFNLTVHHVALLCDVRDDTVRDWLYQGKIEYRKVPEILPSLRISRSSLLDFSKNYHHGRYYVDKDMIRFVATAPALLRIAKPEWDDKNIDKHIKKVIFAYKEAKKNANKTNESQL